MAAAAPHWAVLSAPGAGARRAWEHTLEELAAAYHPSWRPARHAVLQPDTAALLQIGRGAMDVGTPRSWAARQLGSLGSLGSGAAGHRGPQGFCPSCKVEGRIFEAVSDGENAERGALQAVSTEASGKSFPAEGVYAVDEYRLGSGLEPFFWAHPSHYMWKQQWDGAGRRDTWTRGGMSRWAPHIRRGSNVIDIGANVGDTTVEMATRAAGRTVGFEAHPKTAMSLLAQSVVNPQLRIDAHPMAVADTDGVMELNVDCDGCNAGPVETRRWSGQTVIQVPKVRLDTFLLKNYGQDFLREVSFIKIDTEGYDKTLLRVLKPVLQAGRPNIWVEWFAPFKAGAEDAVSEGSRDLFAAVGEIGYVPVHPKTGARLTPHNRDYVKDLLLLPN